MAHPSGLLAAFGQIDAATDAIKALKQNGYEGFTVFSPAPLHELEHAVDNKVSPVRMWTLIGGLTGLASAYAMTMWMSFDYPIVVGGKPIGSIIPYVVILFELTVLLGASATIIGLLFHAWKSTRENPAPFDGRFTDDQIGIFVPCPVERKEQVQELLNTAGAAEVKFETAG